MGFFGNQFEKPSTDENALVKRAESNLDILAEDLKNSNWTEVLDSLKHSELNSPSITEKMSSEAQERFKSLIAETKEFFEAQKENIDKDLVDSIEQTLNEISEKL
jgi:F0F1-type ATP synthase membrane subunit b/b'